MEDGLKQRNVLFAAVALASLIAVTGLQPAKAQQPYQRTSISVLQADRLIESATREARARNVALAIVVVDETGEIVIARRMDGALPHTLAIAHGKARTAARMRMPTRRLQESLKSGDLGFLAIDGMVPIQGGLPVKLGNATIGAIAASGAPAPVDEAVAQAGLAALEVTASPH